MDQSTLLLLADQPEEVQRFCQSYINTPNGQAAGGTSEGVWQNIQQVARFFKTDLAGAIAYLEDCPNPG